ncbi:MAG: VirB3 family type IV secretion system protein [Pseudomonadota bacterium]
MQTSDGLPLGYQVPLHRALTEPILLGGAPRMAAILNATIAAAIGLGMQLILVGIVYWIVSHSLSVWAAKRDPNFVEVLLRHIRHKGYLSC